MMLPFLSLLSITRELYTLSKLQHPNVLQLIGARAHPPGYTLVLPRLLIGSASRAVHELHWYPTAAAVLKASYQLASALSYVHSHWLVHRDIKLSNVFLTDVRPDVDSLCAFVAKLLAIMFVMHQLIVPKPFPFRAAAGTCCQAV